MRHVFLIALAALTTASVPFASAHQSREQNRSKAPTSLPLRPKAAVNPCAEYGPGFVRMEGSSTCVRIGGNVSVGVGASR
jgi:hypothetical protein